MESGTRLDSAVFKLTPTRTRCDLILTANGKAEKMVSGLLNPFLEHLKTAQYQISKGGYSIVLEPETSSDATWFTKGTVERFVRFVGTPELLERVFTVELEILQAKEAIAIQSSNYIGLSTVEKHQEELVDSLKVDKPVLDANKEEIIAIYEPGVDQPQANGSIGNESDSKVQLLRFLETRKAVLQKEQGMAFARAAATGFDIDHIERLISFAKFFGAPRLMDACLRFMELWKRKHEMDQWVEIEATEAISNPPDFSRRGSHTSSVDTINSYDKEDMICKKGPDGGQRKAFKNYLQRDGDETKRVINHRTLALGKEAQLKQNQVRADDDPLLLGGQNPGKTQGRISSFQSLDENIMHMPKESNDKILSRGDCHPGEGKGCIDGQIQFTEIEGSGGVYRKAGIHDIMIHGPKNQSEFAVSSSDPFGADHGAAIDMNSKLPSLLQKPDCCSGISGSNAIYESDDLSLMLERGVEKSSAGYARAFDYEMQLHASDDVAVINRKKEVADVKHTYKKFGRDQSSKVIRNTSNKKQLSGTEKGKPSTLSPLDDPRARDGRLQRFKADLQRVKKQKEEEMIKRREVLKVEREKRIAARSNSTASPPMPSQKSRKQLLKKRPPGSQKGSKVSDSEPGSFSCILNAPKSSIVSGSSSCAKISKPCSSNNGSHSASNRLSRSMPSSPELKKENKVIASEPKTSMAKARRSPDPKMSRRHHVPSVELQRAGTVLKPKPSDGFKRKKISTIINLEKTEAATLPKLKIKTCKGPADGIQSIPAEKETTQKVNGAISSITSETSNLNRKSDDIFEHSDMDDTLVIEKTIVMLECQKPSASTAYASDEMTGLLRAHYDNNTPIEESEEVSEYAPIRAPVSPFNMDEDEREPIGHSLMEQPSSYEVLTVYEQKESPELSSMSDAKETYQAPLARVSSLEDACTGNSEYGKAPPTSLEKLITGADTAIALVSDFKNLKLDRTHETLEKSQLRQSSKGLRQLLKLGRKNHSSAAGDHQPEADNVSVTGFDASNDVKNNVASSEVPTLKNPISQDETPSASTTQKPSGAFSLLSPLLARITKRSW